MKILIPPSEGKSSNNSTDTKFKNTDNIFFKEIRQVIKQLKELEVSELPKIYGTSEEKANKIHQMNINIFDADCTPAYSRYTGVVYNALGANTLDKDAIEYCNNNFIITSALLGLVSPGNLIPNYKLKMSVLKLTDFWKPKFSKIFEQEDLIIDVLPQIHRKSFTASTNTIRIDFYKYKDGKKVSAGHQGKSIKGKFLRFMAINRIDNIIDLKKFREDGYIWDEDGFVNEN